MTPRDLARLISRLLIACLCLSAIACATVQPYEREHLSRPGMDTAREGASDRFYGHVRESREGGLPESDTPGGGCGCN